MITGIEHTAIASPDPLRLAQWYVEHLDFVIVYQPAGARTVFIRAADGSMLEIIESNAAPRPPQDMHDRGIRHLAIAVDDFDAALARLQSKAVTFLTAPQKSGGNSLVFFYDADENILHLIHRETPIP